jgi:hypothetical protein
MLIPHRNARRSPALQWAWGSPRWALCVLLSSACVGLETVPEDGLQVGDPCLVSDESHPEFGGFSEAEVNIEDGGSCGAVNVCLVHQFRGRASCPDGQISGAAGGCTTPDGTPVLVPVEPQLPTRPPELGMVCSCRCDGPDPSATYCECPLGMRCEELIRSSTPEADDDRAGSYCVY